MVIGLYSILPSPPKSHDNNGKNAFRHSKFVFFSLFSLISYFGWCCVWEWCKGRPKLDFSVKKVGVPLIHKSKKWGLSLTLIKFSRWPPLARLRPATALHRGRPPPRERRPTRKFDQGLGLSSLFWFGGCKYPQFFFEKSCFWRKPEEKTTNIGNLKENVNKIKIWLAKRVF